MTDGNEEDVVILFVARLVQAATVPAATASLDPINYKEKSKELKFEIFAMFFLTLKLLSWLLTYLRHQ